MRTRAILLCALFTASLSACAHSLEPVGTGGNGGAATSNTNAGTGGTDAGGCVASMELVVDGAAPVELAYACNGNSAYPMVPSDRASGYLWTSMPQGVVIVGCHSSIAAGVGFAMYSPGATGTGTFTMGGAMGGWDVLTTDDSPDVWGYTGDTQSITITSFGEVGEPIVGTFSATVSDIKNFATRAVSGSFHVCRTADVMASP